MKRMLALMLVILLSASLPACHYSRSGDILEPVVFFYPRKTTAFVYGAADGVIASEVREASGHVGDLNYLLAMYLRGPQDVTLRSPFPADCTMEKVYTEDDTLHIRFSAEFAALENTELTIACAALAKTCLSLTGLPYVSIESRNDDHSVHMILDADSVLLADYSAFEAQTSTEPPQ